MQEIKLVNISPTLRRLLIHCEVNCTVDCCHALAFDLSVNRIMQWFESERIDRAELLQEEISDIINMLSITTPVAELNSRDLNSKWPSDELKIFFSNLRLAIIDALQELK